MLYLLGPLRIETWPFNVHGITQDGQTDFAVKPVVGAEPPLEFVGEASNTVELDGVIWPNERDGAEALNSLEILTAMRRSGKSHYLVRGDGVPFGWFAILSVSTRSSNLDRDGVGRRVAISISLRRAQKPAAQSYFSVISRLVG